MWQVVIHLTKEQLSSDYQFKSSNNGLVIQFLRQLYLCKFCTFIMELVMPHRTLLQKFLLKNWPKFQNTLSIEQCLCHCKLKQMVWQPILSTKLTSNTTITFHNLLHPFFLWEASNKGFSKITFLQNITKKIFSWLSMWVPWPRGDILMNHEKLKPIEFTKNFSYFHSFRADMTTNEAC